MGKSSYGLWRVLDEIGKGGQGTVYRAANTEQLTAVKQRVSTALKQFTNGVNYRPRGFDTLDDLLEFRNTLQTVLGPDMGCMIVALKVLNEPSEKALKRLRNEVEVLRKVKARGLIEVVDAHFEEGWIAFRYYPGGTLADQLYRFKGEPLAAAKALIQVAEAVKALHDNDIVHRDIKPENIFLDENGAFVLGDCQLAFDSETDGTRVTATTERVGTRRWMPPWLVYKNRVEPDMITASFDTFALARLLWTMIAGEDALDGHQFEDDQFNLRRRFSRDVRMYHVNEFLRSYLQLRESEMAPYDSFGRSLHRLTRTLRAEDCRQCRLCETGRYAGSVAKQDGKSTLVCNKCGHVVQFLETLPWWVADFGVAGFLLDPGEERPHS